MDTDNVISHCWVIEDVDHGVQPIIFLQSPNVDSIYQKQHLFFNVFEAKKFIVNDLDYAGKVYVSKNFPFTIPTETEKNVGGI